MPLVTPAPPPLSACPSRRSETSPRRPRPRICTCRLAVPSSPRPLGCSTSTTTSMPSPTLSCHSLRSIPPPATALQEPPVPSSAVGHASSAALLMSQRGALNAVENATTLSHILASVVGALDADSRNFWCQMMDTLAQRGPAGNVDYGVSIAPALPCLAEQAYLNNGHLLDRGREGMCGMCGGKRPIEREFGWVDEDDEEDGSGVYIPSFEAYICDVLDEPGKTEFASERFRGGAAANAINSRALLARFGEHLGMSKEEVEVAVSELYAQDWSDEEMFEEDEYMSGLSDTESLDRSDNGACR